MILVRVGHPNPVVLSKDRYEIDERTVLDLYCQSRMILRKNHPFHNSSCWTDRGLIPNDCDDVDCEYKMNHKIDSVRTMVFCGHHENAVPIGAGI